MGESTTEEPAKSGKASQTAGSPAGPESAPDLADGSSAPISVLHDPRLDGRGNAPVRIAVMRQAQQTYGNRALRRLIQAQRTADPAPAPPTHEPTLVADHEAATPPTAANGVAVQRQPAPGTVTGITVAGATAVGSAGDSFVTTTGAAAVTVTAQLSVPVAGLAPGAVKWSGGRAGADHSQRLLPTAGARQRVITARLGGASRTVRIFVVSAAAPPGAAAAATLTHTLGGRSNPGSNFGLTVVTIGQQGVAGPRFDVTAFFAGNQWSFRVT